jgi:hypothetical protein
MFGRKNNNNLQSGNTRNNSSDEKFQRNWHVGEFFECIIHTVLLGLILKTFCTIVHRHLTFFFSLLIYMNMKKNKN